jgi:mRNA-degrading endonuclease RelE of RelBE toxin-antitoxin system
VELEKLKIAGLNDIYSVPQVQKEFEKAVNEKWKNNPPWERYQRKLIQDLAVLDQEKEQAIELAYFEKLSGEDNLYSIRHPETKKNVRILYTIEEGVVILLTAFLEKNEGDYLIAMRKAKRRRRMLLEE